MHVLNKKKKDLKYTHKLCFKELGGGEDKLSSK